MIKEADENWLPYYYLNPGSSCYNSQRNTTVKIESPEQITSFLNRYLNHELLPILDNENLENPSNLDRSIFSNGSFPI